MPRVTITVPESNSQPYRFQLDREVVMIGRGEGNDIVVDSGSVSTHHAEMRRVLGGYELHDLGSTNGVKLDGVRQPFVPLFHGTTAFLGDVAFDFSLTDEEQAFLAAEVPAEPDPGVVHVPAPDAPISTQPMGHVVKPRPVPKRQIVRVDEEDRGSFMAALLLIIFAAVAFAIGVGIRHQKDTGGSLLDHIKAKREGRVPDQTPPPVPDAAAAPAAPAPPPPVVPMPAPAPSDGKPLPLPGDVAPAPEAPAPQE